MKLKAALSLSPVKTALCWVDDARLGRVLMLVYPCKNHTRCQGFTWVAVATDGPPSNQTFACVPVMTTTDEGTQDGWIPQIPQESGVLA